MHVSAVMRGLKTAQKLHKTWQAMLNYLSSTTGNDAHLVILERTCAVYKCVAVQNAQMSWWCSWKNHICRPTLLTHHFASCTLLFIQRKSFARWNKMQQSVFKASREHARVQTCMAALALSDCIVENTAFFQTIKQSFCQQLCSVQSHFYGHGNSTGFLWT